MSKHTKAELLGIVLRLEATMTERSLASVMEINPESGKAECSSGYSVLPKDELRMRELVLAKTERIRNWYLGKISRGELTWDVETYNWVMDDYAMEGVVLQSMSKDGKPEEVTVLTYLDGRPGPGTRFVQTGIQNIRGERSGVFYKEEVRLLPVKEYASVRIGHNPDDPRLLGVTEPKRVYWGKDELEEDLILEEAVYGPSDPRNHTLEETFPEREYPSDWLWLPEIPPTVVAKPRRYQSDRILRDAGIATCAHRCLALMATT